MNIPTIYADWVRYFDAFVEAEGSQEEEILLRMEQGSIEWTAGVADKLTRRFYEVLELRLKRISEQLNTDFSRASRHESDIVLALVNARGRFAMMQRLVSLNAFPAEVRSAMEEALVAYVRDTQSSLEESARGDRSGTLRMIIKNNSLLRFQQVEQKTDQVGSGFSQVEPTPQLKRRRVIL